MRCFVGFIVRLQSVPVLDEPETSEVHAAWEDEDTMMATIKTKDEVYTIEVVDLL